MSCSTRWRGDGREAAVIGLGKSGVAAALLLRRDTASRSTPPMTRDQRRPAPRRWAGDGSAPAGVEVELGAPRPRAHRAGGRGGRGAGRAARRAAGRRRARRRRADRVPRSTSGFAALPGDALRRRSPAPTARPRPRRSSAHLLPAGGLRAVAAGNIGRPLARWRSSATPPEWVALELSSFQLHDTPDLVPDGRRADQPRARPPRPLRHPRGVLRRQGAALPQRRRRLGLGEQRRRRRGASADGRGVPGRQLRFSAARRGRRLVRSRRRAADAGRRAAAAARPSCRCWATTTSPTRSRAALIARASRAASPARSPRGCRTFRALPHRLEPVREVDGVLWINDSKATNVASTEVAVAGARPAVRAAAGRAAQGRAVHPARRRCCATAAAAVVAYGESGDLVEQDLAGAVPVVRGGRLRRGAARGAGAWPGRATRCCSRPPARATTCSSNYEERGAQFRAAGGGALMTAPMVRHPGELRWETRLLAVVTATLVVFGIATVYGALEPGADQGRRRPQASRSASSSARCVGGILLVVDRADGLPRVAARWPGRCCSSPSCCSSSRCCRSPTASRRSSTAPGAGCRSGRSSFQPSELARLAVVIWCAMLAAKKGEQVREFKKGVLPFLVGDGRVSLLILLEPNMSMATLVALLRRDGAVLRRRQDRPLHAARPRRGAAGGCRRHHGAVPA